MHKIFVVASTEFGSAIRTKAFFVGILMLPIIWGGAILIQVFAGKADTKPRPFAVVDHTGSLYPVIRDAAKVRNASILGKDGKPKAPPFEPQTVANSGKTAEALQLELSDRVRRGELFAYVVIPAGVIKGEGPDATVQYHSDNPNYDDLNDWLIRTLNGEIRARRYRSAGIDPTLATRLERPVIAENLGLVSRVTAAAPTAGAEAPASGIKAAEKVDPIRTGVVPAVLLFVVFMVVMASAPQLLNSVIEEKMSRISEVLLGSLSPFELMMGKLIGNVGIALLLSLLYVSAGYGVAAYYGYGDVVPPHLLALLAFFVVLAVLLFGSLYMAIGSACSELKDAQSLMMPVILLSTLPMMCWLPVLRSPSSPLAVGLSLFPSSAPFIMLMRMALRPEPPIWQVVVSVILTTVTAVACVWAAGKILRTGLLMQGKAASFAEMARWVMAR